ncbi:unnamed protein product [Haemonchus placei]|uniref:Transthyretin-like family protein n=1 Tax=Haemonchus placei TaxID=6290 RepID=A0A0N4WED4_HAEPC|nr:unnamed protein product [Haemonchus placei]
MLILSLLCIIGVVTANTECIWAVGRLLCNKNQTRVLNTVIEVWDKDSAIIPLLNFLNPDDKAGFTVVDNENGIFKVEGCAADYDLLGPLLPPNRPDFYFHVRHMCDSDKLVLMMLEAFATVYWLESFFFFAKL